MTPDELDAIEARAAAATPGPWAAEDERHGKGSCSCCGEVLYAWNIVAPSREIVVSAMDDVTPGVHGDADATFIAHARTDVPALITALREAWAEEAEARTDAQEWETACRHREAERDEAIREARLSRESTEKAVARAKNAEGERDALTAMVEWLSEVIVDARDACQRAESIEPSGSPEWVESGIAMRTTVLREVRAILDRERTAHPSALDKVTDRAEKAEAEVAALRERVADLEGQLAMRGTP